MKKLFYHILVILVVVFALKSQAQMTALGGAGVTFDGSGGGGGGPTTTVGTVASWNPATAYVVDDLVVYANDFYRRVISGTTATVPSLDNTNWAQVSPDGLPYWNASKSYLVDDMVRYLDKIYVRLVAGVSASNPATDGTNWKLHALVSIPDTDTLPEGATNLYFTEPRVLGTDLLGFVSGAGIISASDTVLSAINKLDGNVATKEDAIVMNNGELLIGNGGTGYTKATLTGTANQVNVANGAGSITLSTPQDIATTSSPTFASATLTGLTDDRLIYPSAGGGLTSSGVTLNVSNELLGASRFTVDNLQLDANTVSSTNVNGNIELSPNGTGKVVVNADLDVLGTVTNVSQASLSTANATIIVNENGTQATADANDAGVVVQMTDATDAQIGYDSALASRFKVGDVGALAEVVTTTHTQELFNKTIHVENNYVEAQKVASLVRNTSGVTILKGSVVYINGFHVGSGLPTVGLADADNPAMMPAIGIVDVDIANNATGQMVFAGAVEGLNTSSYAVQQPLYVSTTPGQLTNVRPTGSSVQVQKMAMVMRSNASTGAIGVIGSGRSNDVPNDVTLPTGGSLQTSTSAGNTVNLKAYDVDGVSYTTFGTLTANNTPTFSLLPTSLTMNGTMSFPLLTVSKPLLLNGSGQVTSGNIDISTMVTGSIPATSVSNTPSGGIAATNVQTAINELDSEKQRKGVNTFHVGASREYTTIQAALTAAGPAVDLSDNKEPIVIYVDGGTYDEDLTIPSGRIVHMVAMGTVVLGDGLGSNWSSTNARNITMQFDSAQSFGASAPRFGLSLTSSVPSDATSTFIANVGSWNISGQINSTGNATHALVLESVVVNGIINKTGAGALNVIARNSYFKGAVNIATAGTLQRIENCQFDALVTALDFNEIRNSEIKAGMTVTGVGNYMPPSGMFATTFTGTFTGPASSLKLDSSTNYYFEGNGASLGGSATKVLLEKLYATDITNTPSGNLAATTVQAAVNELQSDIDTRALNSDLTAHLTDTTDAHAASAITNTPAGNIAAINAQTAINELDSEKVAKAGDTMTGALGIGGAPDSVAQLDVQSTTKGFLKPRMTTAQRDAITPVEGLEIYNLTIKQMQYYNGTAWISY